MPTQQRLAVLNAAAHSQPTDGRAEAFRVGDLLDQFAPLTREPVYSIPRGVLDRLPAKIHDWLSPAELRDEQRFTELCDSHYSLGVFLGEFIDHPCFAQAEMVPITSQNHEAYLSSPDASLIAMQHSERIVTGALEEVHERQDAYLGWLLTNPQFLEERNALRKRWDATVQRLAAWRGAHECEGAGVFIADDTDYQQMSNEFEQFCAGGMSAICRPGIYPFRSE